MAFCLNFVGTFCLANFSLFFHFKITRNNINILAGLEGFVLSSHLRFAAETRTPSLCSVRPFESLIICHRHIIQLTYRYNFSNNINILAGLEGFEPPTPGFGDRCSTDWSYSPNGSPCEPYASCTICNIFLSLSCQDHSFYF